MSARNVAERVSEALNTLAMVVSGTPEITTEGVDARIIEAMSQLLRAAAAIRTKQVLMIGDFNGRDVSDVRDAKRMIRLVKESQRLAEKQILLRADIKRVAVEILSRYGVRACDVPAAPAK